MQLLNFSGDVKLKRGQSALVQSMPTSLLSLKVTSKNLLKSKLQLLRLEPVKTQSTNLHL